MHNNQNLLREVESGIVSGELDPWRYGFMNSFILNLKEMSNYGI